MNDTQAFDDARRTTEQAIRTAYPSQSVSGRQFKLEACAYAAERAAAHSVSDRFGSNHEITSAYRKVAEYYGLQTAPETRGLLDQVLKG